MGHLVRGDKACPVRFVWPTRKVSAKPPAPPRSIKDLQDLVRSRPKPEADCPSAARKRSRNQIAGDKTASAANSSSGYKQFRPGRLERPLVVVCGDNGIRPDMACVRASWTGNKSLRRCGLKSGN